MRHLFVLLSLSLGLSGSAFGEETGRRSIPVTLKGEVAESIFYQGRLESELHRVERAGGYEEYEVSSLETEKASFRCYKLIGATFDMKKSREKFIYHCEALIYR